MNKIFKFSFLLLFCAAFIVSCGESSSTESSSSDTSEADAGSTDSGAFGEMKGNEIVNFVRPFYNAAKNMNGEFDKAKWEEVKEVQGQGQVTLMAEAADFMEAGVIGDKATLYLTVPEEFGNSSVECSFKTDDNLDKIVVDHDNGKYSMVSVRGTLESAMTVNLKSESSMSVSISLVDCELVGVK